MEKNSFQQKLLQKALERFNNAPIPKTPKAVIEIVDTIHPERSGVYEWNDATGGRIVIGKKIK